MPAVLRIALPVPLPTLFDYLPPEAGQASVGSRVLVPFGKSTAVGVVVASDVETTVGQARLKRALRVLDDAPLLDAELMADPGLGRRLLAWRPWRGVCQRVAAGVARGPCASRHPRGNVGAHAGRSQRA